MDEADLTIAAVIRQARILLGYTQMQVAEFADMSFGEYQRMLMRLSVYSYGY